MTTPVQVASRHRPTREIFTLTKGPDDYLIYAPLRGRVLTGNASLVNRLSRIVEQCAGDGSELGDAASIRELEEFGLLEDEAELEFLQDRTLRAFAPSNVTILATSACNFRCRYCYASSGDERVSPRRRIDPSIAQTAIHYAIDNACASGADTCHVSCGGGGEPLGEWKLLAAAVEDARAYAKKRSPALRLAVDVSTNGYLESNAIDWLSTAVQTVTVSLDGPQDIQNDQRPLVGGAPTFDRVVATVEELNRRGGPEVKIRATVSNGYVARVPRWCGSSASGFPCKACSWDLWPMKDGAWRQSMDNPTSTLSPRASGPRSRLQQASENGSARVSSARCSLRSRDSSAV